MDLTRIVNVLIFALLAIGAESWIYKRPKISVGKLWPLGPRWFVVKKPHILPVPIPIPVGKGKVFSFAKGALVGLKTGVVISALPRIQMSVNGQPMPSLLPAPAAAPAPQVVTKYVEVQRAPAPEPIYRSAPAPAPEPAYQPEYEPAPEPAPRKKKVKKVSSGFKITIGGADD
ncbi:hypothetical protein HDE_11419 [Halotydeus destructor]|nr:hypothetical protein HDE_11419 [Halotydeus destructor]